MTVELLNRELYFNQVFFFFWLLHNLALIVILQIFDRGPVTRKPVHLQTRTGSNRSSVGVLQQN